MKSVMQPARLAFDARLESEGLGEFLRSEADQATMQLNITKRCNLSCKHCHVGSGPARDEEMDWDTLRACLDVFAAGPYVSCDITGGAPELNTHYRRLIEEVSRIAEAKRAQGSPVRIITRTNAAILTQPGYENLPELWAAHGIEVAASLPHYEEQKTNRMRGDGVFELVIEGLHALNAAGYGVGPDGEGDGGPCIGHGEMANGEGSAKQSPRPKLTLNLVVNPGGAILPPPQASAEREYKKELKARFGITFDNLLVITNNPVGRFQEFLEGRSKLDAYMNSLYGAFNPATVKGAMCRDQISVDVDGRIFDCDFNQIVDTPVLETCQSSDYPLADAEGNQAKALTIFDLQEKGPSIASPRQIRVGDHCYACTAGAGSSCGGSTT